MISPYLLLCRFGEPGLGAIWAANNTNEGVKAFTLSAAGAKVRKGSGIVARKHGSKLPNYVQSAASGEKNPSVTISAEEK
jgi:hypothetical protein